MSGFTSCANARKFWSAFDWSAAMVLSFPRSEPSGSVPSSTSSSANVHRSSNSSLRAFSSIFAYVPTKRSRSTSRMPGTSLFRKSENSCSLASMLSLFTTERAILASTGTSPRISASVSSVLSFSTTGAALPSASVRVPSSPTTEPSPPTK